MTVQPLQKSAIITDIGMVAWMLGILKGKPDNNYYRTCGDCSCGIFWMFVEEISPLISSGGKIVFFISLLFNECF